MNRFLFALGVFAIAGLTIATVTLAMDDPKPPPQPEQPPAKANPIGGFGKAGGFQPPDRTSTFSTLTTRNAATKAALYEEEVETLAANREVKKAIVRAAEIAIKGAEIQVVRVEKLVAANTASREELDKARLEFEGAKAQFEIRVAEMKEVEVRIKFAKKRLDEARAAMVPRVPAKVDPKPVDPLP